MAKVMIRCPKTGDSVPTGMGSDAQSFATLTVNNSSFECSACGEIHSWSTEDAFLADE